MKRNLTQIAIGVVFLTSCQSYRTSFDCPPGTGVPCTSVSEIEKMIIETKEGPDIFVGQKMNKDMCFKKIWVAGAQDLDGTYTPGYYIFIKD